MKAKNLLILGCTAAAVALAAGCGSSSSTTATTATRAASSGQAAPGSRYGAGGGSNTTAAASTANGVVISVKHSKDGTILAAGPKHMTVYLFEADKNGQSACSGACAQNWPPVTTGGEPQGSGSASSSKLGTITRSDGTKQVTYNGHPIYFFVKDGDAGDAYGQGVKAFGADWYVVAPSGNKVDNEAEHSGGGGNAS